jgi:hypothetical protein
MKHQHVEKDSGEWIWKNKIAIGARAACKKMPLIKNPDGL